MLHACELVAMTAGEAHGQLALVLAEDVHDERAALAHGGLRGGRAVEAHEERRRVERHGGDRARGRSVVDAVVVRGDDGHPGREVPDDVAVALSVAHRSPGRSHGRHVTMSRTRVRNVLSDGTRQSTGAVLPARRRRRGSRGAPGPGRRASRADAPRWVFTVASAMCSAAAISALDRPRATSSRIARSRSLRAASRDSSTGASGSVLATCSSSRRVAVGATIASPDATVRIAVSSASGVGVLQQEAARAGAERGERVLVEVEGRQDDHARSSRRRRAP